MLKKRLSAALLALVLALSLAGCTGVPEESPSSPSPSAVPDGAQAIRDNTGSTPLSRHEVTAALDARSRTISVSHALEYVNSTGAELSRVCFNLIPNAFSEYGGGIDIVSSSVDGTSAALTQADGTVYSMELPEPLPSGGSAGFLFEYTVRVPELENRFGWQEGIINAGNFLISPCVFENGDWVVEPYVDTGDAFYTDVADYSVTLELPEGWSAASAGVLGEDGAYHGRMRDYVFCASDGFDTLSGEADGVSVTVYYRDGMSLTAQRALETASNSLLLYNRMLGRYPYETLSVVLSGLTSGVAGTEYPTLVMVKPDMPLEEVTPTDLASTREYNGYVWEFDRSVTHEVAHQWFYGIIGNDQIRYPWLDEGFCRFAEQLYMEEYPPEEPHADWQYDINEFFQTEYDLLTGKLEGISVDMTLDLYEWAEGEPADYGLMYYKAASLWYKLRETLGEDSFGSALREYVDEFAWRFVTPASFRDFWRARGDVDALLSLYGV